MMEQKRLTLKLLYAPALSEIKLFKLTHACEQKMGYCSHINIVFADLILVAKYFTLSSIKYC